MSKESGYAAVSTKFSLPMRKRKRNSTPVPLGPTKRWHKAYSTKQVQGSNGKLSCLECKNDITASRRRTFCSSKCADSFSLKTNSNSVRQQVFKRDQGVCALCKVDCFEGTPAAWKRARGSGHRWQADHIIPVIEGGGVCTLDNYRTLCTSCHKKVTADLAARRAKARKLSKK